MKKGQSGCKFQWYQILFYGIAVSKSHSDGANKIFKFQLDFKTATRSRQTSIYCKFLFKYDTGMRLTYISMLDISLGHLSTPYIFWSPYWCGLPKITSKYVNSNMTMTCLHSIRAIYHNSYPAFPYRYKIFQHHETWSGWVISMLEGNFALIRCFNRSCYIK